MKIKKETFATNLLHYALYECAAAYPELNKRLPVDDYIKELINKFEDYGFVDKIFNSNLSGKELEKLMLNGAQDWLEYSEGGRSLIYNTDIAERIRVKPTRINLLRMQAQKLKNASACIVRAYKVMKPCIIRD